MIVGYCASCVSFHYRGDERPVTGLSRYGSCRRGIEPIHGHYGGCDRYAPRTL